MLSPDGVLQRGPCALGTVHSVIEVTHGEGWLTRQPTKAWLSETLLALWSHGHLAVVSTPHTQPFQGHGYALVLVLPDFFASIVQILLGFRDWQMV